MKILYVDMDNVLVDFPSGLRKVSAAVKERYSGDEDEIPGLFGLMDPMEGALDAYRRLSAAYDTYILSTAPWENPSAWIDKVQWVKRHLGDVAHKRLIISHHKNLNRGDHLIDDRPNNGAEHFTGEWLHFGPKGRFKTWAEVESYLL